MFVVQSGLCNISHNTLLLINDIENVLTICSFRLKTLFEILQNGKCSNGITNVCCLRETLAQNGKKEEIRTLRAYSNKNH